MTDPIITSSKGKIAGLNENGVNKYLGIPFAKPPVGELRFLPPVENEALEDVYEAKTLPNSPMQPLGDSRKTIKEANKN